MRPDRFITLNLVRPIQGIGSSVFGDNLPIFMYHSVSSDAEPGVRPYYQVCTSPQRFREQMQWLKDNCYQAVTLSTGLQLLQNSGASISHHTSISAIGVGLRPVVLTFDDGFRDFYTHAFPILQASGFSATMYLPTAFIGSTPRASDGKRIKDEFPVARRQFKGRECLMWNEVNELHRAGIEFGSHTVNHPELIDLPWPDIRSEITDSKAQIESQLGAPIKAFAYPYAFPQTRPDFVSRFRDLLMAVGYETCVTTQIGRHRLGTDPLRIKRLPVNSGDDVRLFQAKLEGGYDWLALPQGMIKKFKGFIPGSSKRNGDTPQPALSREPVPNARIPNC